MNRTLRLRPLFTAAALLATCLLAPACSCGGGGALAPGSINGLVMDLGTGVGLPGAAVAGGGKSTTTDDRGYFSLTGLSAGQVTVSVTKTGYAPGYATPRASDKPESTLVSLKKQGTPQTYSPGAARTLSQTTEAGPYAVSFLANSLDTSDSSLHVSITPVDPTKEAAVLPGSLVTSSSTVLNPVTFAEFSILDSAGNRVQLKSGQSATVELPIPPSLRAQYPLDSRIHCYAFNGTSGAWDDFVDGTVRVSSVDGVTPVLAAAIKHFSWYGGAPEGNDCYDAVGRVVSAVDGSPLGNARVEATPGGYTYTDADGYFTVVASGGEPDFFAYQTGYDVDGSLTGTPGAKYIEFGRVSVPLSGLTAKPCSTTAPAGAAPPAGTLGSRSNPVQVRVGAIGRAAYEVFAILSTGQVLLTLQSGFPDASGNLVNPQPASGAKITIAGLSGAAGSATLVEAAAGSGLYTLPSSSTLAIEKGQTYRLAIDADGNGSVDGIGTASVVGDLALTSPTAGGTYPAAGFTASWTDTGSSVGGAGYTAVYFLSVTGTGALGSYVGTATSATVFNALMAPGTPLPPGSYTASLVAYSGFAAATGSGGFTQSNNITGVGLTGTAYSVGSAEVVTFTLQ